MSESKYCSGCGVEIEQTQILCNECAEGERQIKIITAAKAICSVEWVILESALLELRKNKRVRDELINKVQCLREAVLNTEQLVGSGKMDRVKE